MGLNVGDGLRWRLRLARVGSDMLLREGLDSDHRRLDVDKKGGYISVR